MKQKRLLVVGAGNDQIAPILLAKEMGHHVLTVDFNPKAPGLTLAHQSAIISTTDYERVLAFAKKNDIDGIMTVASETSIPTIARVVKSLGLPGISEDTAHAATNKNYMRSKVEAAGVRCPQSVEAGSVEDAAHFIANVTGPWVIKPSDTSGQRGITFFDNHEKLPEYFDDALQYSRDQKVIIEEFIAGPEINICAMVNQGKIDFLSFSDRITDPYKNFGIAVKHLVPAKLTQHQMNDIKQASIDSIKAIGLENGIAYPQMINAENGPAFIEIAARMPGGHNREIAMYTSGVDMVKVAIRQALGEKVTYENSQTEDLYPSTFVRFITRNDIPTDKAIITGYEGLSEVGAHPQVKKVFMHLNAGDQIPDLNDSTARFGGIITVGNSREEAIQTAESLVKQIKIY
jgi:biotin carboxylase